MSATICESPVQRVVRNPGMESDVRAGTPMAAEAFAKLRRLALLDGCKWDPQVGDISTLAPFHLVVKTRVWNRLAWQAEQLTWEAFAAEDEVMRRPELLSELGLPRQLRRVLADALPVTPSAGRVMRFDFHPTREGWRISETNSDVPGGFSEASHFTGLMAAQYPHLRSAGNPGETWSQALAAAAGPAGVIALLAAPGYLEDQQVIAFLAGKLRAKGCLAVTAKPEQIAWNNGVAWLETTWHRGPANVVVKFYQAEWLARLPRKTGWNNFFRGGRTSVTNPAAAVISESKRFPLVWNRLSTPMTTWRTLLPETRDPRSVDWFGDDEWLLKTAMCNTGDTVSIRGLMRPRAWAQVRLVARLFPGKWLAQRRFESLPVPTPDGLRHVCLSIYTINGKAAGAYVRLSAGPVIDFRATDAALLLEDDE